MGYIPPMRDAQAVEYGNRIIKESLGIRPVSPIAQGQFQKVLRNQQAQGHYVERNLKKYLSSNNRNSKQKRLNKTISAIMSELTGKGNHFDQHI